MVSLDTIILTEEKFWFANFTKNCLKWSAKRQNRSVNMRFADHSFEPSVYLKMYVYNTCIHAKWKKKQLECCFLRTCLSEFEIKRIWNFVIRWCLCSTLYKVTFSNLITKFFTFFEKNIYRCYKFSLYSYQYDKIHTGYIQMTWTNYTNSCSNIPWTFGIAFLSP